MFTAGVPSAPGQVISTRETDTSLLIQWAPPKDPNNLIGYYIDQCVKGGKDWTSANHKPHSSTKYVPVGSCCFMLDSIQRRPAVPNSHTSSVFVS